MNATLKSLLWWVFAIIFTISIAVYQRLTGPTHPVRGQLVINDQPFKYKLITSHGGDEDAPIKIQIDQEDISAKLIYRRFKSQDQWVEKIFIENENQLIAFLPHQPPAGKLEYYVMLSHKEKIYKLNEEAVIIRFKGEEPKWVLLPHIFFMFMAMLFSTRTGIEAMINGKKTYSYAWVTVVGLFTGGLILGPILQKYAFGDYWTGWPFGGDLTDNKTLISFIFWLIALLSLRKNRKSKIWVIVAAIIMLAIYFIPHSMFGSQLDVDSGQVVTGRN
ncbi:MAG: hypothetical protein JEZ03_04355 [Bacteroidales bacterium]|nr:hypothetical protein [Bacteroidales bacterium]